MIAFVLINTSPLYEHEVYNTLIRKTNILEVHPLFGEYDIIVKIEGNTPDEISDIIVKDIRNIKGVLVTKTLTGFTKWMKKSLKRN